VNAYDPLTRTVIVCAVQFSKTRAEKAKTSGLFKTIVLTHSDDVLYATLREARQRQNPTFQISKGVAVCCTQCGAADSLKICARCQDAVYCCKMCQRRDWLVHKSECNCIAAMKGVA
jgi:MYND finger